MWSIHTRQYYSAIKRHEVWFMLQWEWTLKTSLSERSQIQNAMWCIISFIWNIHYSQIYRDRKQISNCDGATKGRRATQEWEMTLMGTEFPFGVTKKSFKTRWWWWLHNIVNVLNDSELYVLKMLKWKILWCVYFTINFKCFIGMLILLKLCPLL